MKKILISLVLAASIIAIPARATSTASLPIQPNTIAGYIQQDAAEFGVNPDIMNRVIQCESGGDPLAIGDHGTSFGLVQIHMPDHPEVTTTEAFNPAFAVRYLAQKIGSGQGHIWTCFKRMKLSTSTDLTIAPPGV